VIVGWGGHAVVNSGDLRIIVARMEPGTKTQVTFYRDGKRTELTITVAERPNQRAQ
jgi:S1-C subfamily serine protease